MVDAAERLVNLAFFLAAAQEPVSNARIRVEVAGYPVDGTDEAFRRMFERDKEDLRDFGFVIDSDENGMYWLDASATYAAEVELAPEEAAAIRSAAAALVDDPAFPFPEDLRLALAKLPADADVPAAPAAVALVEARASEQGADAGVIADAAQARKAIEFDYTNARGESARRHIEPYGLFIRDGRWYVVGRDSDRDALRVFALERASELSVNDRSVKTPDFVRPEDFDVAAYIMLPFQYGLADSAFEAVLEFEPSVAWRAKALSAGRGALEPCGDAVLWRVSVRDRDRLLRFVVENGPGIRIAEPSGLTAELAAELRKAGALHG